MVSAPPETRMPLDGGQPDATGAEPARPPTGWARRLETAVPAAFLVVLFAACFLLPAVAPVPEPVGGDIADSDLPPLSPGHLLGTDALGNDVFSRLLYGGRVSLFIAIAVNLVGLVLGGLLGAFSAYWGGATDAVLMRVLDVLIAFPSLVIAMTIAQGLGPSAGNTILALSFFSVPAFARTARAATLRLREQPYIAAAVMCGTRTRRVLLRHVAPNILPQLITFGLLGMGIIIVIEGALSFLQLGVPLPNPSWGNMIYQGQQTISTAPLLVLFPSAVLFLSTLAFNLLGDALRARWNMT